jgi:hypothetical protein
LSVTSHENFLKEKKLGQKKILRGDGRNTHMMILSKEIRLA